MQAQHRIAWPFIAHGPALWFVLGIALLLGDACVNGHLSTGKRRSQLAYSRDSFRRGILKQTFTVEYVDLMQRGMVGFRLLAATFSGSANEPNDFYDYDELTIMN